MHYIARSYFRRMLLDFDTQVGGHNAGSVCMLPPMHAGPAFHAVAPQHAALFNLVHITGRPNYLHATG